MPVEINLLPKRKKKDRTIIRLISIVSTLSLLSVLLITVYAKLVESETEQLEQQYDELRIKSAQLQGDIDEMDDSDEAKLISLIKELEDKVVPASQVLHEVVTRMPEQGYLIEYDYRSPFHLDLEIAFIEMKDLSYYYVELMDSPFVDDVNVQSLFGDEITIDEEETLLTEEYLPHYKTYLSITLNPDAIKAHNESGGELEDDIEEVEGEDVDDES